MSITQTRKSGTQKIWMPVEGQAEIGEKRTHQSADREHNTKSNVSRKKNDTAKEAFANEKNNSCKYSINLILAKNRMSQNAE